MTTTTKQWLARARVWLQDERGLGLVESLAAVAILGVVVAAFVVALSSGTIAVRKGDQEVVAQSLAQTQLEYVKGYPYDPNCPMAWAIRGLAQHITGEKINSEGSS